MLENNVKYERYGKCDPGKCGQACCRFTAVKIGRKNKRVNDYLVVRADFIKDDFAYYNSPSCKNLTIHGRCRVHNKQSQPNVCKYFPMSPDDGIYKLVKKYCGYKFRKVK